MAGRLLPVVMILLIALPIGCIDAVVVCRYGPDDVAWVKVATLASALQLFHKDVGRFPRTAEGLEVLVEGEAIPGWFGPYLETQTLPMDPWGHPYLYVGAPTGDSFMVCSFGADAQLGGVGTDTEICKASADTVQ